MHRPFRALTAATIAALAGTAGTTAAAPPPASISLSTLDGATGLRLNGVAALDLSGMSVAGAGDLNGDGVDDLVIGAYRASPGGRTGAGAAYVVFGKQAGSGSFSATLELSTLDGVSGFRIDGAAAGDGAGWAVASAGDLNGDGVADLAICARSASPGGRFLAGSTYVVFGKKIGAFPAALDLSTLGAAGFRIDGAATLDFSGRSLARAGDVNGDGVDDLILGAAGASPGGRSHAGSTYVVFGRNTAVAGPFPAVFPLSGVNGVTGFRLDGAAINEYSGFSVAGAGDCNGDGVADIAIGAYRAGPGGRFYAGSTYVVFGKHTSAVGAFPASLELSGLTGVNGFRLDGASSSDYSGSAVARAGDCNGDGVGDLLIGARGADPGGRTGAGSTYVVFGKHTSVEGAFPPFMNLSDLAAGAGFRLDGALPDDASGRAVAPAGDVNADGVDDILIGASGVDMPGAFNSGAAYVVYGKRTSVAGPFPGELPLSTLDGLTGFRAAGVGQNSFAGYSVASAGDFNGDGLADILLGAYRASPDAARTNAGASYVVFGRSLLTIERAVVASGGGSSAAEVIDARSSVPSPLVVTGTIGQHDSSFSSGGRFQVRGGFWFTPGVAACPGDANGDRVVDFFDLNFVLTDFGQVGAGLPGDLDHDGDCDFFDLNLLLTGFGTAC